MDVRIKRAYEAATDDDGFRVLVDRLWPRGVSKADAELDAWLKNVAPSPDLRRWWDHDPERMDEFAARYTAELDDAVHREAVDKLRADVAEHDRVTLVYGARDPVVNHARVLRDFLVS